ncbi:hypothetical protein [Streptomyces tsukubensis]|uniref:Uncharacterized protein n=1 Tax=Streptomyces tsukubensis TaxID=83656 RepID=A0A1V4AC89_9ACTN|nr:hypothetical protein [Streptomyces tsukubensis]OON80869.1 hypothetical protein B1H18_10825 [Streptomyces tsukubensis]QFR93490.1 hypothetical protein GBW32_10840 [Streptomyces tsukubensis]
MGAQVTSEGARHAQLCVDEAEDAVRELRQALARVGIKLPSLGLDPLSMAREAPCPLVELGRCSVEVAHRLAVVLPSGKGE